MSVCSGKEGKEGTKDGLKHPVAGTTEPPGGFVENNASFLRRMHI